MDPAWVISDYERTQKLKGSKVSESTPLQAEQSLDSKTDQISEEDAKKIADISKYYKTACDLMPYNYVSREETEVLSVTKIRIIYIGVISTAIRRYISIYIANSKRNIYILNYLLNIHIIKNCFTDLSVLRE